MKVYRKLVLDFQVPAQYDRTTITQIIRAITHQVNDLSEGMIRARYNAQSSVPNSAGVTYAPGDQVPDSNPTVQGSIAPGVASNYVRGGAIKTGDGTLHELRFFTGD